MSNGRRRLRTALFAGVSSLALIVGASQLRAADVPATVPKAVLKAPPPVQVGMLTVWLEGGAFWSGGDPFRLVVPDEFVDFFGVSRLGSVPGLAAFRPRVGWEAAAGADWRFADSPWHVSFDVRFGAARSRDQAFSTAFTTLTPNLFFSEPFSAQERVRERENHWVADLMIGRDIGLGSGQTQVKLGIRVAGLEAKVHSDAQANTVTSFQTCFTNGSGSQSCINHFTPVSAALNLDERSRFIGVGPRQAIEGSFPLGGPWAVDYMGGLAVLFGQRQLDINGTAVSSSAFFGFGPTAQFPFHTRITESTSVFNADASAALSYWFTRQAKLSVGFQFDGYWNPLKTVSTNNVITDVGRFYYGPFVRLAGQF